MRKILTPLAFVAFFALTAPPVVAQTLTHAGTRQSPFATPPLAVPAADLNAETGTRHASRVKHVAMHMECAGIERRGIIATVGRTCGYTATIATVTGTMSTCAASSAVISREAAPTVHAGAGRICTIALSHSHL